MTKTKLNLAILATMAATALTVWLCRSKSEPEDSPSAQPQTDTPSREEAADARKERMRALGKKSGEKRKAKKAAAEAVAEENGGV